MLIGIPLITILEISGNYPEDIVVTFGGPSTENGKYVGWITRGEGHRYKPLLNSEPIFDTPEQAKQAMQKVVDECIEAANEVLNDKSHPVTQFLTSPEGETAQKIADMAKNGIPE